MHVVDNVARLTTAYTRYWLYSRYVSAELVEIVTFVFANSFTVKANRRVYANRLLLRANLQIGRGIESIRNVNSNSDRSLPNFSDNSSINGCSFLLRRLKFERSGIVSLYRGKSNNTHCFAGECNRNDLYI